MGLCPDLHKHPPTLPASSLSLSLSSLPETSFESVQRLFQPGDSLVLINTFLSFSSHGSRLIEMKTTHLASAEENISLQLARILGVDEP